jgi:copper chaperone CopZ
MPSTTYSVRGMTCQNCVGKVRDAIESVPGVTSAEVSLDDQTATVETASEPDFETMRKAVAAKGSYTLSTDAATSASSADTAGEPGESLYPLLLIVGYITGTVLLIGAATDTWSVMTMMRHFMAGFFIVFSFFKLLDLPGFVNAYYSYDLIARAMPKWGWVYPFVELALGVLYLLDAVPIATNIITLVLMLVGSAGVLKALKENRRIQCACLGTALNLPMTKVTLVEDLTMAAMAGAMLVLYAAG